MTAPAPPSFTSFDGTVRIASGSLRDNVLAVKKAAESGAKGPLLVFDDQSGCVVEVDLRGSDAEVLARLPAGPTTAEQAKPEAASAEAAGQPRGRGRPKLGVVAREVTLLPRHWDWLSAQPGGASVALRKLVEEARRASATRDEKRTAQERAYRFMSTMAGDMAGFEECARALFAGDLHGLSERSARWPADIRDHLQRLASCHET